MIRPALERGGGEGERRDTSKDEADTRYKNEDLSLVSYVASETEGFTKEDYEAAEEEVEDGLGHSIWRSFI